MQPMKRPDRLTRMEHDGRKKTQPTDELAKLREEIARVEESERECRRAQEALEKESRFVSAVLDTAGALVLVLDTKGRIVRFNHACERATGYTFDEVKDKSLWDLFILPEEAGPVRGVFEELKGGKFPNEFENHWVTKDGSRRLIAWSNTSLPDDHGSVEYVIGTGIDITERRRAEEATNRLHHDLRCQAAKLEMVNRELEAFSYSVSHDLRNPLLGIRGFCRILLKRYSAKLNEEGQKFLRIIDSGAQEMLKFIDDLLAFSISENQQIKSSNIDMKELAKAVFEELKGAAFERTLQPSFGMLPSAWGDQGMIRRVFLNLVSNAIKFTKMRKTGIIEIGGHVKENQNIYYVRDNGIGFDMEFSDKLFVAFERFSDSDEFDGTGLGLAIVQRIIHRHGGEVWAEGEVDRGATFYFSLPRLNPAEVRYQNPIGKTNGLDNPENMAG
jgi:PAS domain S-box-containing protein